MYDWIKYCVFGTHIPEDQAEYLQELYETAVKSDNNDRIFNLRRDIVYQDQMLVQITAMAAFLRSECNEEVIEILQGDPYNINLTFDNLNADIDRMMAIHKSKKVKLQKNIAEYEKHIESHGEAPPPSEQDWYSQLRVLSKWMGYHLKPKELTVGEYIVYLNDFKSDIKRHQDEEKQSN